MSKRSITIDQIKPADLETRLKLPASLLACALRKWARSITPGENAQSHLTLSIKVRPASDAGGRACTDLYEPASDAEAMLATAMRDAPWPHKILAEVIS